MVWFLCGRYAQNGVIAVVFEIQRPLIILGCFQKNPFKLVEPQKAKNQGSTKHQRDSNPHAPCRPRRLPVCWSQKNKKMLNEISVRFEPTRTLSPAASMARPPSGSPARIVVSGRTRGAASSGQQMLPRASRTVRKAVPARATIWSYTPQARKTFSRSPTV